jgi:hypothetical protein
VLLPAVAVVLLTACGSGGSGQTVAAASSASGSTPVTSTAGEETPEAGTTSPAGAATSPTTPTPAVTYRSVTVTEKVPFSTRTVQDATLAAGTTRVRTRGVAGVATVTYRIVERGGVQMGRTLLSRVVTRSPVTQVTVVGTKRAAQCDPNYSGACVPIASDVDCAGGSGNGPAYVQGPVRVVGTDIYRLDSDGDGIACE